MEILYENLLAIQWQQLVMWVIGAILIYLAIVKKYEPMLLLPIAFGMFIASAEMIYNILTLKRIFKCLIHYTVLLIAFIVVFMVGEFLTVNGPASVFVGIVVFSILYFFILGIVILVRRTVSIADERLDARLPKRTENKKKNEKSAYTPKFK